MNEIRKYDEQEPFPLSQRWERARLDDPDYILGMQSRWHARIRKANGLPTPAFSLRKGSPGKTLFERANIKIMAALCHRALREPTFAPTLQK